MEEVASAVVYVNGDPEAGISHTYYDILGPFIFDDEPHREEFRSLLCTAFTQLTGEAVTIRFSDEERT